MKKLTAVVTAITLAVGISSIAQDKQSEFSLSLDTSYVSKYIGSQTAGMCDNEPCLQQDVILTHNDTGLYFELWGNKGFHHDDGVWSDEIDYGLGWKKEWLESVASDLGVTYYQCNAFHKQHVTNYYNPYLSLSYPLHFGKLDITPRIKFNGYIPTEDDGTGGVGFSYGLSSQYKLTEKLRLIGGVAHALNDGVYGHEPGGNIQAKIGVERSLWTNSSISAEYHRSFIQEKEFDRGNGDEWVVITLSQSF